MTVFIATFGYVGYFPIAPGTAGSAAALALYALVRWFGTPAAELVTIVTVLILGVWAAHGTERALNLKDPGVVVIDEVLGMLMTLAFMPLSVWGIVAAFLLFRIFDVIKPFPAGRLEHLPGGFGIMADDAMAGVYGQILMRMAIATWPQWLTM
ncbi:MAG TPA: phosphatidylglycerophosphatase A [Vicinamibacterales bacterium]|nr:phosphatidylglycerophosphatase A [Vicinamibacterales bacterium]